GRRQPDSGRYVITAQDAHAWPELFFSGIGWVRFEPTPRSGTASAPPPAWSTPGPGVLPDPDASLQPTARPSASASSNVPPTRRPDGSGSTTTEPTFLDRMAELPWRTIGVIAVLLGIAVAPFTAERLARRRRWRRATTGTQRTEAAWEDL